MARPFGADRHRHDVAIALYELGHENWCDTDDAVSHLVQAELQENRAQPVVELRDAVPFGTAYSPPQGIEKVQH